MPLDKEYSLKDILHDMAGSLNWREKLYETKIRQIWKEKMGTTINQHTHEIKYRKGKLFITLTSAALKQEMTYGKDKIQDMMNLEIGADAVQQVVIR